MLLSLSLLLACPKEVPVEAAPAVPVLPEYASTVLADMDPTTDACEDFYQYACGGWLARTELPSDKASWTRSFSVIAESNQAFLMDQLKAAAADPSAGDANWAKLGAAYSACTNADARDSADVSALDATRERIAAVSNLEELSTLVGELQLVGADPFFGMGIEGDYKDPTLTILHLGQGGISLPDRDYYLEADNAELMVAYTETIAAMFVQAGWADAETAKTKADAVVAFETAMARTHLPKAELRDPTTTYHRIELQGLEDQVGVLDWAQVMAGMGGPEITTINVERPEVMASTFALIQDTPMDTLHAYLDWRLLRSMGSSLPPKLYAISFDIFGKQVYGQMEPEPLEKRCVRFVDGAMGEALGQSFVDARFAGESKATALTMVESIQDAFEADLPDLEWMDDATRAAAIEKKNALVNQIGYPDTWKDYSSLEMGSDHVANAMASRLFDAQEAIARVGKPTDPTRWLMSPPTVNAYYHPLYNQIVFPAGILQEPFFNAEWPMVMNYGGIGMVMGHELTHGFDDQGRKFDPQGRMNDWWAPEASAAFEERAQCVVDQFNGFQVAEGLNVNGELTLGENIADLGGIKVSFSAWQAYAQAHGQPTDELGTSIPGLTDAQLFFISYAQGWCTVSSPEHDKMLVLSNPHSPARFRIQGPLSNLPEFHEAFGCDSGTGMHPEKTCEVW